MRRKAEVAPAATTIAAARSLAAAHFDRARGEPPSPELDRDAWAERAQFVELVGDRASELDGAGPVMQGVILGRLYRDHLRAIGLLEYDRA